ncbi:DUF2584 family protein [Sinobaca sp. H24]|uniref:DUF2584 family protein n=1 Tax=Sinobaca sp. H24 TaxID=2923376 RepID=UPI00207A3D01|nr:DUF2584 family protein [Sinobaca sp. H24]
MGFKMEMNWEIITHKQAERLDERKFELIKDGYQMYPMDTALPIHTYEDKEAFGKAVIVKVEWGSGRTTMYYELVSLASVN